MKTGICAVLVGCCTWLGAPSARGEMVVEWWGKAEYARHKGLEREPSKYGQDLHGLRFDLSALPRGTKVYHASLRMHSMVEKVRTDRRAYMNIGQGVFYYDPLRLYAEFRPDQPIEIFMATGPDDGGKADFDKGKPLALEPPQFKSFDATEAVQRCLAGRQAELGLIVRQTGWRWDPDKSILEIRYEGKVADPPEQAAGIKVVHRKGQTFITWTEIDKIISKEQVYWKEFEETFKKYAPRAGRFYRIYRHAKPITAANLDQAERIDEIWPLSGYDARLHQHVVRGENWVGLDPDVLVTRYVIEAPPPGLLPANSTYEDARPQPEWRGKQLPLQTGLYVYQVPKAGKSYYAVTTCMDGVENTRDVTAANSLKEPVEETVALGEPILYRWMAQQVGRGRDRQPAETQFFVYWAAPPYANQPRRPIHIQVGLVGANPPRDVRVRHSMRAMYGNEIIRGTHSREWQGDTRILTIVCDASFMTKGYYDSWNTLKPKRAPSQYQPYAERMAELLTAWAQQLSPRVPPPQAGQ